MELPAAAVPLVVLWFWEDTLILLKGDLAPHHTCRLSMALSKQHSS